jgi:hypothetical protein
MFYTNRQKELTNIKNDSIKTTKWAKGLQKNYQSPDNWTYKEKEY